MVSLEFLVEMVSPAPLAPLDLRGYKDRLVEGPCTSDYKVTYYQKVQII